MQRAVFVAGFLAAFLALTSSSFAMSCVAYVRAATSFDLSGDAWQWWDAAAGVYLRGHTPEPGSVLVFARTWYMRQGHVALVREVRSAREILIDQANWGVGKHKGSIDEAVSVIDVSAHNDWSEVRVQWGRGEDYGRVNPIRGFIYADNGQRFAQN